MGLFFPTQLSISAVTEQLESAEVCESSAIATLSLPGRATSRVSNRPSDLRSSDIRPALPVYFSPPASPSHCRFFRTLRNKPHARAIALATARRLARIFPHHMPVRSMPALANFFRILTRTARRLPIQFFVAHRSTLPKTFPQFVRILPLSQALSVPQLAPLCVSLATSIRITM